MWCPNDKYNAGFIESFLMLYDGFFKWVSRANTENKTFNERHPQIANWMYDERIDQTQGN